MVIFWCSDYLPLVADFYMTLFLLPISNPPASVEQFSQGYLRCCLKLEISKNSHQRKHNSQLLGCDYFFLVDNTHSSPKGSTSNFTSLWVLTGP